MPLGLISMADRPSSTISKTLLKPFRGWIKPPKSTNGSANSTQVSQPPASSEYIGSILVLSNSTSSRRQCNLESGYLLSWIPTSWTHHQAFQICWISSWIKVRLQYAQSSRLRIDFGHNSYRRTNVDEFSKAGLGLEGGSWSGFAVRTNAPQEAAGLCRY